MWTDIILESTLYFAFSLSICCCKRYFSSKYYSLILVYLSSVTLWFYWIGARACNNGDGLKWKSVYRISSDFSLELLTFNFCLFLKKFTICELTYFEISPCRTLSILLIFFMDKALTKVFFLSILSPFLWQLKRSSYSFFLVKRSYACCSSSDS